MLLEQGPHLDGEPAGLSWPRLAGPVSCYSQDQGPYSQLTNRPNKLVCFSLRGVYCLVSSLLGRFVSYEENKVYTAPVIEMKARFWGFCESQ
jgi:hypothetical protein